MPVKLEIYNAEKRKEFMINNKELIFVEVKYECQLGPIACLSSRLANSLEMRFYLSVMRPFAVKQKI